MKGKEVAYKKRMGCSLLVSLPSFFACSFTMVLLLLLLLLLLLPPLPTHIDMHTCIEEERDETMSSFFSFPPHRLQLLLTG